MTVTPQRTGDWEGGSGGGEVGAPPRRTGTGRRKGDAASVQSTGQHRMSKRIAAAHVGMHCACFILLLVYLSMNERRKVTDPRTDISFQCGPCVCLLAHGTPES